MKRKTAPHVQYAALPYRRPANLELEVLLITSRETRRWIIPKGWRVQKLPPHRSAAHEAMEEAGLVGRIGKSSIGSYGYQKRLSTGSVIPCRVMVFALKVSKQLASWPEQDQRRTKWFKPETAAKAVEEPELRAIIKNLDLLLKKRRRTRAASSPKPRR
jgi:8-oxo-dGTP pyrophosphatase MutT (NUDIX family)